MSIFAKLCQARLNLRFVQELFHKKAYLRGEVLSSVLFNTSQPNHSQPGDNIEEPIDSWVVEYNRKMETENANGQSTDHSNTETAHI